MKEKKLPIRLGKKELACLAAGVFLGLAAEINSWQASRIQENQLSRPGYGQEEESRTVLVEGLEEEKIPVEVALSGRHYGETERQELYDRTAAELPELIRGENPSLDQVYGDLNLITFLEDSGLHISWQSEDSELLDRFGKVYTEGLSPEGQELLLQAELSDGQESAAYSFRIRLIPRPQTEEQRRLAGFQELLKQEDENQRQTPWLKLPDGYEGKSLSYSLPRESSFFTLTFMGGLAAVLMWFRDRSQEEQKKRERESQMLLDYPEVISKLIIFLGAGMTIRGAWQRIAGDYERQKSSGRQKPRWIYEKVCETCHRMEQGLSEGKAYLELGQSTGLRPYMKLCSLLEQNRKNGSKNIRELLRLEMAEAFETRKQAARRLGEEAGTRLLVPLFLMLAVVMVMIAFPAMLEFL